MNATDISLKDDRFHLKYGIFFNCRVLIRSWWFRHDIKPNRPDDLVKTSTKTNNHPERRITIPFSTSNSDEVSTVSPLIRLSISVIQLHNKNTNPFTSIDHCYFFSICFGIHRRLLSYFTHTIFYPYRHDYIPPLPMRLLV